MIVNVINWKKYYICQVSESDYIKIFEQAYSDYLNRLEFFAFSFLHDREEASSIVSEVFAKMWEKRESVDFSKSIYPLLSTMTRNSCLNNLRNKKYQYEYADYRMKSFDEDVLADSRSDSLLGKEVQQIINRTIVEMPPNIQDVYILSRLKNMKNREIAEYLNVSISTVEVRIASAFKILRLRLKDYLIFFIVFFLI